MPESKIQPVAVIFGLGERAPFFPWAMQFRDEALTILSIADMMAMHPEFTTKVLESALPVIAIAVEGAADALLQ